MREVISSAESPKAKARTTEPRSAPVAGAGEAVPLEHRSKLGARLGAGDPVVTVDILPPHGWNPSEVVEPARALRDAGVDAVSLADTVRSRSRMSALSAATVIEREVGIETMVRYACRGRDMFAMISDLLGAAAVGLRNVLIVSGEPPGTGPYPDAASALDLDSLGLTKVIQGLNRGSDPGGNPIRTPTRFVQGVEVDPSAPDQQYEWTRFRAKIDAGADFAVTRPLFEPARLAPILDLAAPTDLPVIAGIWLLPTLRSAEFLANEVPGVDVPEGTVDRMRRADRSGTEAALAEGVAIALEVIEATRTQVQGFHLNAPRTNVEVAIRVVRDAGLGASSPRTGSGTV